MEVNGVEDARVNRGEEVTELRQCEETVDLCKETRNKKKVLNSSELVY